LIRHVPVALHVARIGLVALETAGASSGDDGADAWRSA